MKIEALEAALGNPIARREWAQWRRSRAHWIAPVFLAAVLALLISALPKRDHHFFWGREMLGILGLTCGALSVLLPPALAAPSIASEREARLLEALQLTRLGPGDIVIGKWAGAFCRALCLLLAGLPIHLATVGMGGVSVSEALLVWACEVVAAAFSCTGAIFCSSWGRTALGATRSAYGFAILHALAAANALAVAGSGRAFLFPLPISLGEHARFVAAWLGASHPVAALGLAWWQPWREEIASGDASWILAQPILPVSLALQVLAAAALLILARGGVQRPFEAAPLLQRKASESESEHNLGWWALPVERLARGANPVHRREFVTKFRMRAVPRVVIAFEAILALGVAIFYARAFWMGVFEPGSRGLIWWALVLVAVLVGMTSLLVMGASGLARERELGTWDSLRLSFLSPGQVVRGKASAMLAASVLFSAPFWPLMALCVRGWRTGPHGIGAVEAALSVAILLSMTWSHAAFGLWLSARMKSSAATLCAIAAMFAWDLALPLAASAIAGGKSWLLDFNAAFNPVLALLRLSEAPPGAKLSGAAISILSLTVSGALLLWDLHANLKREWGAAYESRPSTCEPVAQ